MRKTLPLLLILTASLSATQATSQPNWSAVDEETLRHFQALVRMDTTDPPGTPPGGEKPVAEYVKQVLDKEGIPAQLYALEPNRPNVVARLKGNGKKRPLLIIGHSDTVNVDAKKWSYPPFSAERNGGFVYGRGTIDDKDNLTAMLMTMLLIKRNNVPLDRDVIFLSEGGEEGATRIGIQFMVNQHWDAIDAEYCFAEGGNVTRVGGKVKYASIQTVEKIPRAIKLTSKGTAGHGSVPLEDNAVAHLGEAVGAIAQWTPPTRLNETTATYFKRLAQVSTPEEAARYRDALSPDPAVAKPAQDYLRKNEPRHWSMLRTSLSPTIINGGYRSNVIPSEATANIDVRQAPDEDPAKFLDLVRQVVNDPQITVEYANPNSANRPPTPTARLDSDAFKALESTITKHYSSITLPALSTGATDMSYLRSKGMQCYGIGPALDIEDGPKGFGAHSDQERIVESELYRFVHFSYDAVVEVARAR